LFAANDRENNDVALPDFDRDELDDFMNANLFTLLAHNSQDKKASFTDGHSAPNMASHQEEVYSHSFCVEPEHHQLENAYSTAEAGDQNLQ